MHPWKVVGNDSLFGFVGKGEQARLLSAVLTGIIQAM
jgi:hypothetical protein